MIGLLVAAAFVPTAIHAERAFAHDAQLRGQWTAFRATAADDAVMFVPKPTYAFAFLRGRADPPTSVDWWPSLSLASCDGSVAVNHGPWIKAASHGTFTTVWLRRSSVWKWAYDGGKPAIGAMPTRQRPTVRRASCRHLPAPIRNAGGSPMPDAGPGSAGAGSSDDGSLRWAWTADAAFNRRFTVDQWDGRAFKQVYSETVAANE